MLNNAFGLKRLSALSSLEDDDLNVKVSDQFPLIKINKKGPVPHFYIGEFSNLNTLDFQNMEEKRIKITTTTQLHTVLSIFINDYKYLPRLIVVRSLVSWSLLLKSNLMCTIR